MERHKDALVHRSDGSTHIEMIHSMASKSEIESMPAPTQTPEPTPESTPALHVPVAYVNTYAICGSIFIQTHNDSEQNTYSSDATLPSCVDKRSIWRWRTRKYITIAVSYFVENQKISMFLSRRHCARIRWLSADGAGDDHRFCKPMIAPHPTPPPPPLLPRPHASLQRILKCCASLAKEHLARYECKRKCHVSLLDHAWYVDSRMDIGHSSAARAHGGYLRDEGMKDIPGITGTSVHKMDLTWACRLRTHIYLFLYLFLFIFKFFGES